VSSQPRLPRYEAGAFSSAISDFVLVCPPKKDEAPQGATPPTHNPVRII